MRKFHKNYSSQRPPAPYVLLGRGIVRKTLPSLVDGPMGPRTVFNTWNFTALVTQSQQFLPNTSRTSLLIINKSANSIFVLFGSPAATNTGIQIVGGQALEFLKPSHETIHVISITGNSDFQIVEGVEK